MITRSKTRAMSNIPITSTSAAAKPSTADSPVVSPRYAGSERSKASSSRSSATIRARKANATAEHMRRQIEREIELANAERAREQRLAKLQHQLEVQELEAEMASIEADASSDHGSHRSRVSEMRQKQTDNWVRQSSTAVECDNITGTLPGQRTTIPLASKGTAPVLDVPTNNPLYTQTPIAISAKATEPLSFPATINCDNVLLKAVADTAAAAKAIASNQTKQIKSELIPFFGNPLHWIQFKRVYDMSKSYFSQVENITRLQNAIRGPARDAVASIMICENNPDQIVAALEENFARPEMIVLRETTALKNLPRLGNDLKELGNLSNRVRNTVSNIKLLSQLEYLHSPELFHAILGKLNPIMKIRWTDFAIQDFSKRPKLEMLSDFLVREYQQYIKFGLSPESILAQPSTSFERPSKRENVHVATDTDTTNNNNKKECIYCKKQHNIKSCSAYKLLSVDDRWRWLREARVCYRCLKPNRHMWKTCKTPCCGVDGCKFKHHPLLHGIQYPQNNDILQTTEQNNVSENKVIISNTMQQSNIDFNSQCSRALLKIVPVTVSGPTGTRDVYALLDDGSTATLIEASVAAAIGATGPIQNITVNGVGGLSTNASISYVDFRIKGRYTHDTFLIKNARAMKGLALSSQTLRSENILSYAHLADLVDILPYEDVTPSVLIGAEHWYLSITHDVRKGNHNQPVACLTALGWTLYGVTSSKTKLVEFVNHTTWSTNLNQNLELDFLIKEHYKLDSIGICKQETIKSKQDVRAIEILENTTRRLPSGRFEVGMPWRDDIKNLPNSYPQAMSRFLNLERRMRHDSDFAKAYKAFIDNMLDKQYAEECDPDTYYDSCQSQGQHSEAIRFYLPHFGVYHPQKRKLRVVLDAAAKNDGLNLNSLLIPGPDLLKSLLDILFRFREGRIALTADIKEMFSQIRVRSQDRDALRYLWRPIVSTCESITKSVIKEYRMSTVIFGASCSPFIAQFIKNKNAKEFINSYPKAVDAIINSHYMDDYVDSIDSVDEAAQLAADIVTIHKAACMEMRGWTSNNCAALSLISPNLRAARPSGVDPTATLNDTKVLGVVWNPENDLISFRDPGLALPNPLTKRGVLSYLMQVYDPFGLLGPIVIKGRILFQKTWRSGIDWDTQLPASEVSKWNDWKSELARAVAIKIPRCYTPTESTELLQRELHVFSDASEQVYACVAFWRFIYSDGTVKVALISSKARVSPLKPTSIPRLELQAALIGSRLATTIQNGHRRKPDRKYFWTDSMIVLGWLRSDARTFKPFVAHRIGEILDNSDVNEWRWVPSGLNVADDITRSHTIEFSSTHRWFVGPSFLTNCSNSWPIQPTKFSQNSSESKAKPAEFVSAISVELLPKPVTANLNHFSDWLRLVRATARAHQAIEKFGNILTHIRNCKSNDSIIRPLRLRITSTTLPPLSANLIKAAERHILQRIQLDSFLEEYNAVIHSQPLSSRSRLLKLSPVLGEDQLLHLAGRIKAVEGIDPNTCFPIILDGRHPAVRLLVQSFHRRAGHANNELVINEIRQKFWIIRLRDTVRTIANKCMFCKIRKTKPMSPVTGDLPPQRLAHHQRPFSYSGVDYFGPITITIGRRHEKRYVALFTCLTCRAVHLEIVHSLSSDSAIMALRRFIARRGVPNTIFSDNGTAFVGANRILKEFHSDSLLDFAASKGINWSFIPAAAPTFGGCWERLVRTVKVALNATLHERAPREETLLTLLAEAEAIVNSRPLAHVSTDPNDPTTLTPFHFLIGTSSNEILNITFNDNVLAGRSEWKKALQLADNFWNRWVREVLPMMQPRNKTKSSDNLKTGDIVIIADGTLPRRTWPRGRITKTYPGKDGVVRVVDVETAGGVLRRPVLKLVKLI